MSVINLRNRDAEGNRPDYDVYIGRTCGVFQGTKWSNPWSQVYYPVEECLENFEQMFWNTPELFESIAELKGKVLACWCAPNPCHGDFLY